MAKNGSLEFCTVLYSKYDEKVGNCERKTLELVVFAEICRFSCNFTCQFRFLAKNHVARDSRKISDRKLVKKREKK